MEILNGFGETMKLNLSPQRISDLGKEHFFGYYYNAQFDCTGTKVLGLECEISGQWQTPESSAALGVIDLERGNSWSPFAFTRAWNWQMGAMLQWLPDHKGKVIYNDRQAEGFVSVVRDIENGVCEQIISSPVYAVSPDGKTGLTLNFSRLWDTRPETGYCGFRDPHAERAAPEEDGIYRVDLESGKKELIVSHHDLTRFGEIEDDLSKGKYYFTHLLFNESGKRFMFWHRRLSSAGSLYSRIYTADINGKNIHYITENNSHSAWKGEDTVIVWCSMDCRKSFHNYMFRDMGDDVSILGEAVIDFNGHFTFSPDCSWLLTDMRDKSGTRTLILYHPETKRRFDLAAFCPKKEKEEGFRCDLHPRWDNEGTRICIDSTHEGSRQMYIFNVKDIVRAQ